MRFMIAAVAAALFAVTPVAAEQWRISSPDGGLGCFDKASMKALEAAAETGDFQIRFAELMGAGKCTIVPAGEVLDYVQEKGIGWERFFRLRRPNGEVLYVGTGFVDMVH